MKKLILLILLLLNVTMNAKVVFDPDKVDPKLVEQIEADMDARKLKRLSNNLRGYSPIGEPDTFEVVRILKTVGEENSYHGVAEVVGISGKGNYARGRTDYGVGYVFKAKTDEKGNLKELELMRTFEEYEKSVHQYFEKLARKHLGEYVRARGGGDLDYNFNPAAFYMTFDEMVSDTNAGIGLSEEITGGAKIYIFNEMNSQEEIDKLREKLFNLVKEMQQIKMNYEVLYIYVVKPIALLSQEEISRFTKGAALSNCVEKSEKMENTCGYVVKVMRDVNKVMDETVDRIDKTESAVKYMDRMVNKISYDGLTRFDNTVYADLDTQLGFNHIFKVKKVENIIFGEYRNGEYYGLNYYKKGIDEEERRKRLEELDRRKKLYEKTMEELKEEAQKFRKK